METVIRDNNYKGVKEQSKWISEGRTFLKDGTDVEKALGNSECGLFEEQQRGLVGAVNEVESRQKAQGAMEGKLSGPLFDTTLMSVESLGNMVLDKEYWFSQHLQIFMFQYCTQRCMLHTSVKEVCLETSLVLHGWDFTLPRQGARSLVGEIDPIGNS